MNELNTFQNPIVLFDGICNYCSKSVQLMIRFNTKKNLRYTALQSNTAQQLLQQYSIACLPNSIVFIDNNKVYLYSTAVLKIVKHLSFPFCCLIVFIIVPACIRNKLYQWFAKHRYRWFGKKNSCMIPAPEIKQYFINTL